MNCAWNLFLKLPHHLLVRILTFQAYKTISNMENQTDNISFPQPVMQNFIELEG